MTTRVCLEVNPDGNTSVSSSLGPSRISRMYILRVHITRCDKGHTDGVWNFLTHTDRDFGCRVGILGLSTLIQSVETMVENLVTTSLFRQVVVDKSVVRLLRGGSSRGSPLCQRGRLVPFQDQFEDGWGKLECYSSVGV